MTLVGVENNVKNLVLHQDDAYLQEVFEWISPIDYSALQRDTLARRQAGTGQWLLISAEYQQWQSNAGEKKMLCPGIPGAGKSVMAATVTADLQTSFGLDKDIAIVYIFCRYDQRYTQTEIGLLSSLLRQLVQGQEDVSDFITAMHKSHKAKRSVPSLQEIQTAVQRTMESFRKVYIVIDALDECDATCRKSVLDMIQQTRTSSGMMPKLFATSRYVRGVLDFFEDGLTLEIRASDGDVGLYLDGQMPKLPKFVKKDSEEYAEIRTAIIKATDGM